MFMFTILCIQSAYCVFLNGFFCGTRGHFGCNIYRPFTSRVIASRFFPIDCERWHWYALSKFVDVDFRESGVGGTRWWSWMLQFVGSCRLSWSGWRCWQSFVVVRCSTTALCGQHWRVTDADDTDTQSSWKQGWNVRVGWWKPSWWQVALGENFAATVSDCFTSVTAAACCWPNCTARLDTRSVCVLVVLHVTCISWAF